MRIITCNIRASTMGLDFGPRKWKNRKDYCLDTILAQAPDIICVQECQREQFSDFCSRLGADWGSFGMRLAPDGGPENTIFYRRAFARAADAGGYWLSKTPHIPGSKSWDSECVRLANYVILETAEGLLRVVNTHTDHASQQAREEQTRLINEDASVWENFMPQILTGDLNCDVNNPAMKLLFSAGWRDTYAEATGIADERFTAHDFLGEAWNGDLGVCGNGKMDWILVRGPVRTLSSALVMDHRDDLYPSDHYFVTAELALAQSK